VRAVFLALLAVSLTAGDDVPGWVREIAAQQTPAYPAKVALVTLLDDVSLTIGPDGRQITRERGAVKVLQHGRKAPGAYCLYNPKTGKVREFQAWLLPPAGKPTVFGKNAVVDRSLSDKYDFDEERVKVVEAGGDLAPGAVFAWEIVDDEKTVFTADEHSFQDGPEPVLLSRYSLSLPSGWVASGALFNHEALEPQISGTAYTWELRNLPWIEPEQHSPGLHALAPRLGVNYYPEDAVKPGLRPVRKWRDVSVWQAALMDPPAAVTDAIRSKAAALTAGSTAELDKIRAIAAFVQKTNYVAVEINLARGGGYTPHSADQTLARNYGDCKDKATLMRSLLKAVGIEAYPVGIYYGDRQYVRPEWPSPFQFNHAIIAIRVSHETKLPTVVENRTLGRLLIFDPTDSVTPVGNLPESEQGSHALIVAGSDGDLITVPLLPPDRNRVESTADAQLRADGSLAAHLQRLYCGQQASHLRYMATYEKSDELKRTFEETLSNRLGGLTLQKIEPADRLADDQFQLNMDVAVKQFGQVLQGRLLMVAPGTLGRRTTYAFPAKPRTLPVRLEAEAFQDSVAIAMPPQFKVDEIPDPVQLSSAYGSYKATWRADKDKILFEQSLEVKSTTAPAAEYTQIRQFFEKVESAQNSAVVLVKE
jgi:hypothetical protein